MASAVTSSLVIVDDDDPLLAYLGPGWTSDRTGRLDNTGHRGPPYLHSLHRTSTTGSVSFQYNGSYIHVYSSFDSTADHEIAEWKCAVDSVQIYNDNPPQTSTNHWRICDSTSVALASGLHNFTLEITFVPKNSTFWLDWIGYVPATGASFERASILLLPQDSEISYNGPWIHHNYDNSTGTSANGSSVVLSFVGVSASWYGSIFQTANVSTGCGSWSIDGGVPVVFTWTTQKNYTAYNHIFFSTPEYGSGPHQLRVTYLGSSPSISPLSLSQIIVQNGTLPLSASTPTMNPTSSSSSALYKRLMAIYGGVLGGILGIFLIGLAIGCYLWRRREKRWKIEPSPDSELHVIGQSSAAEARPIPAVSSDRNA